MMNYRQLTMPCSKTAIMVAYANQVVDRRTMAWVDDVLLQGEAAVIKRQVPTKLNGKRDTLIFKFILTWAKTAVQLFFIFILIAYL